MLQFRLLTHHALAKPNTGMWACLAQVQAQLPNDKLGVVLRPLLVARQRLAWQDGRRQFRVHAHSTHAHTRTRNQHLGHCPWSAMHTK